MFTARLKAVGALLAAGLATQVLLLATLLGAGWWAMDGDAAPARHNPFARPAPQAGGQSLASAAFNDNPVRLFPAAAAPDAPTVPSRLAVRGTLHNPIDVAALRWRERTTGGAPAPQASLAAGSRVVGALVCAAGLALLLAAVLAWRFASTWAGAAELRKPQQPTQTQQRPR